MKKTILLCLLFLITLVLPAQQREFTIKDLILLTNIPTSKFDNYILKKGYKPHPDMTATEYGTGFSKLGKDNSIVKLVERYDKSDTSAVFYMTNSETEFRELNEELEKQGFVHEEPAGKENKVPTLYQQGAIAVRPAIQLEGGKKTYTFKIERKKLPSAADITHVEDLLLLTSHQNIAAVFGPENVKKDVFYFDENEISSCSVLFPNSSKQVIFIWKDQVHKKDIDYVLIGGHVRAQSSKNYDWPIGMNKWSSRQGVKLGMTLKDLESLNGQPLKFHGWESDQPGIVSPKNTGLLNFKKLGVQLNCFDCHEDQFYQGNDQLISSDTVLRTNSRVYVSMLIILP